MVIFYQVPEKLIDKVDCIINKIDRAKTFFKQLFCRHEYRVAGVSIDVFPSEMLLECSKCKNKKVKAQ